MGSLARSGERSRLPLRCQRCRHLLRHLRPAAQPWHRLRRHLARYRSLCRPLHRHLVETRRIAALGPCSQVAGPGGLRRQQQLPLLGLEDRTSGAGVQRIRLHGNDRTLSHRRFQMESHRASPVLRDFEELGRRATDQLSNHAQLHSHYHYPNRLGGDCLSGPKRISDRPQTGPESDLLSQPQTQHHPTEMELHHCTESVKLILSCPLLLRNQSAPNRRPLSSAVSAFLALTSPLLRADLRVSAPPRQNHTLALSHPLPPRTLLYVSLSISNR